MDYDELIEQWQNGNLTDVAHEVSKMKPSEIVAFCEILARKRYTYSQDSNFTTLERLLIKLES